MYSDLIKLKEELLNFESGLLMCFVLLLPTLYLSFVALVTHDIIDSTWKLKVLLVYYYSDSLIRALITEPPCTCPSNDKNLMFI